MIWNLHLECHTVFFNFPKVNKTAQMWFLQLAIQLRCLMMSSWHQTPDKENLERIGGKAMAVCL